MLINKIHDVNSLFPLWKFLLSSRQRGTFKPRPRSSAKFFDLLLVSPTAQLIGLGNTMTIDFKIVVSLVTVSFLLKKKKVFTIRYAQN